MSEILFQYHKVNPTTWVYLSSLLTIGLYFKFGRFWSVRNLDLVLLILIAPGLLMTQYGGEARGLALQMKAAELEAGQAAPPPPVGSDLVPITPDIAVGNETSVEDSTSDRLPDFRSFVRQPSKETAGEIAAAASAADDEPSPAEKLLEDSLAIERLGYLWLFAVGAALLVRMLIDPTMVRRPLLEPNLSSGGLLFLGCSLFLFLMSNVVTSEMPSEPGGAIEFASMAEIRVGDVPGEATAVTVQRGPGYALLNLLPRISTNPLVPAGVVASRVDRGYIFAAKAIAIFGHLAVVLGIVAIGYWHFGYIRTGVGVATLYLMMPYTAQTTGDIEHVIPAALLTWAVLCYRRPLAAGVFIGLATSLVYYPLFLLPLWISFYWRRGFVRFTSGVVGMMVVMAISLLFIPEASYWENLKQMFGLWLPRQQGLEGIWGLGWDPVYRIPVLAAFIALCGSLAIWPAQKNLGTLLSCSAAVMVGTQFWHGFGGGLYVGWYLPLALLTIFRPNLEDRVALAVLGEGWKARRFHRVNGNFKAA